MADLNKTLHDLNDTADHTAEFDAADIEQNRVMGILAYLSWLVLIPLLFAKDSKFARFHCNQGLVLAIVEILCGVVLKILRGLPLIGWIFSLAGGLLSLACLVLAILGIVNAINGKAKDLPLLGTFHLLS